MSSGSKGRVFRRFLTVSSVFFIATIFAGRLTDYSLAEDLPEKSQVLGVDTEIDIIEVIPEMPQTISIFKPKTIEVKYNDKVYR